jgi:trimethylamine---corrinoid protein Co-methyltransferase
MTDDTATKRRAGTRGGGQQARAGGGRPCHRPDALAHPGQPRPADRTAGCMTGCMAIHRGAMRILSDIGIEMLNPEAVEILRKAGCRCRAPTSAWTRIS